MHKNVGRLTVLCRWICSALVAAPLAYWWILRYQGNAYLLLILALMSVVAGLVLFVNSIYCLRRYRDPGQSAISLLFLLGSVTGVLAMPYALPGWKM
jgi:formate hydrogenlyase subunit 3/multisubunit Na+/H+ antiporter MnhD subunit